MKPQETHVSESKKRIVGDLIDLIKNKKTVLVASIKNIPASQFQEISKKLRGKAIVTVPKKNLIFRALDESGDEIVKQLKEKIKGEGIVILFSDIDSFELAAELMENKSPVKAKPGQEATEDIVIDAGPTDLLPGPAISELGALGIQVQIENGKITIKESKVITKKGEKISAGAADLMNKLDMKPFSIGFIPLSAFDRQDNKLYTEINIDKEKTIEELKLGFGKALAFAVEIGCTNKDTISFLLQKAGRDFKALEKFGGEEKKEEDKEVINEGKTGEAQDETSESEEKKDAANADKGKIDNQEKTDENSESGEEKVGESAEADASKYKENNNEEKISNDGSSVNNPNESSEPVSEQSENPEPLGEIKVDEPKDDETETPKEKPQEENVQPEENQTQTENKSDEENK